MDDVRTPPQMDWLSPVWNRVRVNKAILGVTNNFPESFRVSTIETLAVSAHGVGLKKSMRRAPTPETEVKMIARTFFVPSVITSSSLKRKKASVFPMKEEDMFIAQKTPEFRVIVVGSELLANRFPCAV